MIYLVGYMCGRFWLFRAVLVECCSALLMSYSALHIALYDVLLWVCELYACNRVSLRSVVVVPQYLFAWNVPYCGLVFGVDRLIGCHPLFSDKNVYQYR
jgi:hypothetical protein